MTDIRLVSTGVKERDVIDFLLRNPYFFVKHMEVLGKMKIPRVEGAPIPMVERRLDKLRERAEALEKRQERLESIALVNERAQQRMHKITLDILAATDANAALARLLESLREDFELEYARVCLFVDEKSKERSYAAIDSAYLLDGKAAKALRRAAKGDPVCGSLRPAQRAYVFGEHALAVASHAVIPLRRDALHGMVALGTRDKQRFTADLDTLYLKRLGEMVAAALLRLTKD